MPEQTTTKDAILEAAVHEFAERGLDGVRMEHVARRAGCNKALVYRHFGDRHRLFDAALQRRFSDRRALLDELPEDFGELLVFWAEESRKDPVFMKMILREALEFRGDEPPHASFRRRYYRDQVGLLRRLQEQGRIDPGLDVEMLFIALLAVVTLTTALPQIVTLATGLTPRGRRFRARWHRFLRSLARVLGAGG
ncbi:MAG: TetR/AcrR family transcriptional regulator [Myxococcota bacterium]